MNPACMPLGKAETSHTGLGWASPEDRGASVHIFHQVASLSFPLAQDHDTLTAEKGKLQGVGICHTACRLVQAEPGSGWPAGDAGQLLENQVTSQLGFPLFFPALLRAEQPYPESFAEKEREI